MDSSHHAGKSRLAKLLIVAARIFGALLVGLVLLALAVMWSCAAPSDASLSKRFRSHRAEFDTLSRMSQQDSEVLRIDDDFIGLKNNWAWPRPEAKCWIAADRWNEYRRLFRSAGVSSGVSKDESGNVYFVVHTYGLVVGGSTKGLVHCLNTGDALKVFLPCAEQRDRGQDGVKTEGSSYRRLEADWYIFENWW
jgi:hypothetical protein